MTIPYREWTHFILRTIKGYGDGYALLTAADWTTEHDEYAEIGFHSYHTGSPYTAEREDCLIKPSADDFALPDGMADPIDYLLEADISFIDKHIHVRPPSSLAAVHFGPFVISDPDSSKWDPATVSGRYYNGVAWWDTYPQDLAAVFIDKGWVWGGIQNYASWATLGAKYRAVLFSQIDEPAGSGAISWNSRSSMFRNGMILSAAYCGSSANPPLEAAESSEFWLFNVAPVRLQVRYFNPVVNSLSRYWMGAAGGVPVVLTGLGFHNADSEISSASRYGTPKPGEGTWADYVDYIYFEGLQGQGQYVLKQGALYQFTDDSNVQITIPSMPAMAEGTYNIRLKTAAINDLDVPVLAWAGDWNCAADGRVSAGKRIVFTVGPQTARGAGLMIAGEYAPIDIRVRGIANLVQNGGFATATDWNKSAVTNPALASEAGGISGNCGKVTAQAVTGAGQYIYDKIGGLVIGSPYHFQAWFKKGTASGGFIKLGTTQGGSEYHGWTGLTDAGWTMYSLNFVPTASDLYIALGVEEAGKNAYFDEVNFYAGSKFYDGRILAHSAISRSLAESGPAGTISDMDMDLANADRHFSVKLATELLKNQTIETFCAWKDGPEGDKSTVFTGIIDDYSLAGDVFKMTIRDITQKYFSAKVPREIATKEDFPNIHTDSDGKPVPEIIGLCSYSAVAANGAIAALYIDKTLFKYLCSARAITIVNVYADGVIKAAAEYDISSDINGWMYITFTADQGDKRITFDAAGADYAPWNSVNGYIQNPAYVRAYLLNTIMGIPMAFMDIAAFDTMAAYYVSIGEELSGYLALQDEKECVEVLQELNVTYGDVGFIAKDGRYTLGRKGISDFSAGVVNLFAQTDLLAAPAWLYNMVDAVNYIKGRFNWYPAPEVYCQSERIRYDASVADFGSEMGSEMELPWTTSDNLVTQRLSEELLKLGYGDRKVAFSVPLDFIDVLDLFTNIRLQDPYGADAGGLGEVGHYVYVESMAIDIQNNKIDITAKDYQWILRAYCVLADRAAIADNWATADESDRMFMYLCDRVTGYFADGQPGKILADRNSF